MTAKPIVVVYLPEDFSFGSEGIRIQIIPLMSELNKIYYDYHWFCFTDYELTKPELKVFYEKDFTEIQYQELKTIIEESIKKQE